MGKETKKFNIKDQLAGIAALIAAIVAIGGGFVKYGEITTKLNALSEQTAPDLTPLAAEIGTAKNNIAVNNTTITNLENEIEVIKTKLEDLVSSEAENGKGVAINEKEIQLLKVQIEEIKVSTSNPLAN
jgi:predicted  nucleic acid-binding Zn-ribbon protein